MRARRSLVISTGFILIACTGGGAADTTVTSSTVPVTAPSTTTTAAGPATPPTSSLDALRPQLDFNGDIEGVLPDGSTFTAVADLGWSAVQIEAVTAALMIDLPDGTSRLLGDTQFQLGRPDEPDVEGTLTLAAGVWTVRIAVDPHVLDVLGSGAMETIEAAIEARSSRNLPVLALDQPLRWAHDDETSHDMEVLFTSFAIRRGCSELAAVCSSTNGAQLIPAERLHPGAPAWRDPFVFLLSSAPRPASDPTYLDPGPLQPRGGHSVIWTGTEMIVWGGATGDRPPHLVDGAAFDPDSSTWRLLPTSPFDREQLTHAVWADDRMIVVGNLVTAAYDPAANTWQTIAEGISLPRSRDPVVWTGEHVAVWSPNDVHLLDPDTGTWSSIGHPGFGNPNGWEGTLRTDAGRLFAVGLSSNRCEGRLIAEWSSGEWTLIPETSLATSVYNDCSLANQTGFVDGHLVVWEDNTKPTRAWDFETNEWIPIDGIDIPSAEGPDGPVTLGTGLLVPQWGGATWLSSIDDEWHEYTDLPGDGFSHHMVWTGTELLMWGAECCYGSGNAPFTIDAWRWTLPQG